MADPYMLDPTQYQGMFEPDPELVRKAQEQAKAMAALRMGLGMLGKEPLGSAAAGGFRTYFATQEDARRNAQEQQQLALHKYQLQQKLAEDMRKAAYIKSMDTDTLLAAGIPRVLIEAIKSSKDPAEAVLKMTDFYKPQSGGPGTTVRNWTGAVTSQTPGPNGEIVKYDEQGNPIGYELLPNAAKVAEEKAAAAAGGAARYDFPELPVPGDPTKTTRSVSRAQLAREEQQRLGGGFSGPPAVAAASAAATAAQPQRDNTRVGILMEELRKAQQEGRKGDEAAIRQELQIIANNVRRTAGAGFPSQEKFVQQGERISDPVALDKAKRVMEQETRLPDPGYQWTDETRTTQVPIPGGPKDTSVADKARIKNAIENADSVVKTIDKALEQTSHWSAGMGSLLSGIPLTTALNLDANLKAVQANVGFSALQQMRRESPTGGALGQVAIQELDMLQRTLGSLDQRQSPEQLKKNLEDVKKHYNNLKQEFRKSKVLDEPGATGSWDPAGNLTPQEQSELEMLRKRLGRS